MRTKLLSRKVLSLAMCLTLSGTCFGGTTLKANPIAPKQETYVRLLSENSEPVVDVTKENLEWNLKMVNADDQEAQNVNDKVKIAILDSGIDYTQDIPVVERKNFVPGEEDVSVIYDDCTGHGTGVASIIASKGNENGIVGINPNVEIYSAKVFDFEMRAPISRIVEAINWAVEQKVDIINLSFGTQVNSKELQKAIQTVYDNDILLIAAAGNNGKVEYPAAYDEVVAVGSVNSSGNEAEETATGSLVDLVAPGEKVLSTSHFGGISAVSGTSISAPHVTGIASVLLQKDKSVSADFIREVLNVSANKTIGTENGGNGLVDLSYALEVYDSLIKDYKANVDNIKNDTNKMETYINNLQKNGEIETNNNEVYTEDENNYVEGKWSRNVHVGYVTNANTSNITDTTLLNCVKAGARANDDFVYGMVDNPEMHGYTKFSSGSYDLNNYISAYIFLTAVAKQVYSWKATSAMGTPSYMTNTSFYANTVNGNNHIYYIKNDQTRQSILNEIRVTPTTGDSEKKHVTGTLGGNGNSWTWAQVFNGSTKVGDDFTKSRGFDCGTASYVTKAKVSAFIYGMAVHSATDVFAHSSYELNSDGKTYSHITHSGNKYADDVTHISARNNSAAQVAQNVINRYMNSKSLGSVNDFKVSKFTKGSFYLWFFSDFANNAKNGETIDTQWFTDRSYRGNPSN